MRDEPLPITPLPEDAHQIIEPVDFDFGLRRRTFVQLVATGLMIVAAPWPSSAHERGERRGGCGGGGGPRNVWERIHIGKDGVITLLAGKVEVGQGSRAEYAQAAAEELRVPADQIQVVMSDTGVTPNDGNTAGSGSTPRTVPAIRQAAAAARELLRSDATAGLRSLLDAHPDEILRLDVTDPSMLADMDTWEDYQRHLGSVAYTTGVPSFPQP